MTHPPVTSDTVEALIAAGDVAGMISLFEQASETDRANMRGLADWTRRWRPTSNRDRHPSPQNVAIEVLFAATARAADIAVGMHRINMAPDDLLEPVVAAIEARGERFLHTLGKRMLASSDGWSTPWRLLRSLVRRGLIDPLEIDDDAYIRAFAFGIGDNLAADPALVDREVWRLFEVSGALSLANIAGWDWQLVTVAGRSKELRDRMLDAVLGALATDFAPGQLSACIRLADALSPTDPELADRADAVVALCGVPSPVRSDALGWLERLVDHGGIHPDAAVAALLPALVGREKKMALTALRLADRFAPGESGALAIVPALGHAHPDVATRAVKLLERRIAGDPSPELRAELLANLDAVPAAVRPHVAELAGVPESVPPSREPGPAALLPVPDPDPGAVWADDRRLPVLSDPEQLVAIAATLLEGQGDGDDFELLVAGLPTLAGMDRATRQLFAPLRKRAEQLHSPRRSTSSIMRGSTVANSVGKVVLDIVDDRPTQVLPGVPDTVMGMAVARLYEAGTAVAREAPLAPLATPTHRGGHVQLETYLERAGRGGGLGPADTRQAALRVGLAGTFPHLEVRPVAIPKGSRPDANVCPLEFVRSMPELSDDPMVERGLAFFTWLPGGWAKRRGLDFPHRSWWPWQPDAAVLDVRVATGVLAFRPDLVAAAGTMAFLHPGLDYPYRGEHALPTLQFLGDPSVELEGPALVLLTIGFTAPVGDRAAAVDAAIAAVDQRRLDAVAWGREAALLDATRLVTLQRLAASATDLASAGSTHRSVAQQFLLSLVAHLNEPPPTLYALLDALIELGPDDLHVPAEARVALARLANRSSRAGKSARTVLGSINPPAP